MGDLTQIPTRTIVTSSPTTNVGLGPTKVNRVPMRDPYGYEDAEEANYLRDQVIDLREKVGVDGDSYTDASIQGQLRTLGGSTPGIYRFRDDFEYRAAGAFDPRWTVATGAWATQNAARGGAYAPMDGGVEQFLRFVGYTFYRAALPWMKLRLYWGVINATAPVVQVGFVDAAGTGGWGVEFHKGTSDYFRVYHMIGGATTYTVTPEAPVAETWIDLEVALTGTPGAQVVSAEIDGTASSAAAAAIAQTNWTPKIVVGSGAEAGKKFTVGTCWLGADFREADV
jgi:hypothetical protein